MHISVLSSGSSGNSTFVSTDETNILVDAGISEKRLKKSLSDIGKETKEIDAILITHEHIDHVKGLEKLKKHAITTFMRPATHAAFDSSYPNVTHFNSHFSINELKINAIDISHDAADPVGFMIEEKKTAGVFTDLGKYDDRIKKAVSECHSLVIESNHDIDMLLNGNYPYHLKERILGHKGHLSNIDAGLLVNENAGEDLKNVFLAHLSQNNNTPELALNTFTKLTNNLKINRIITRQNEKTEFIQV